VFVANDDQALETQSESAYEIGITGGFGVKGLNTHAFMNRQDKVDGATGRDLKGHNYGLSYNFGQVTAGYNYKKHVNQTAAAAGVATNKGDVKQNEYGIAFALTPNLTLGANYTKAEPTTTTVKADAKSRSIAVGYNLGAIALTAQAAKLDNYTGVDGVDADVLFLRASTKF
jgi:predicted porin